MAGAARAGWRARRRKAAQALLAGGVAWIGAAEASSPASVRPLVEPVLAAASSDSFTRSTWPGLTADAKDACTALCQPEPMLTMAVACANEVGQLVSDGEATAGGTLVDALCAACCTPVQAAISTAVADAPGLPVEAGAKHGSDVLTVGQATMVCLLRATTVVDCQARGSGGMATLGLTTVLMRQAAALVEGVVGAREQICSALGDKLADKWTSRAVRCVRLLVCACVLPVLTLVLLHLCATGCRR